MMFRFASFLLATAMFAFAGKMFAMTLKVSTGHVVYPVSYDPSYHALCILHFLSPPHIHPNTDEGTLRALAKPTGNGPGTGTCEFGGNGFSSKHDYQLVLVGMNKDQASNFSPRPGDDNSRSMFVQYEVQRLTKLG